MPLETSSSETRRISNYNTFQNNNNSEPIHDSRGFETYTPTIDTLYKLKQHHKMAFFSVIEVPRDQNEWSSSHMPSERIEMIHLCIYGNSRRA